MDIPWQHGDGGRQIWFIDGHQIKNRTGLGDENGAGILIAPPSISCCYSRLLSTIGRRWALSALS